MIETTEMIKVLKQAGFSQHDAELFTAGCGTGATSMMLKALSNYSQISQEDREAKRTAEAVEARKTAEREKQLQELKRIEEQMNQSMSTPVAQLGSLDDSTMSQIIQDAEHRAAIEQQAADLAQIEKTASAAMGL